MPPWKSPRGKAGSQMQVAWTPNLAFSIQMPPIHFLLPGSSQNQQKDCVHNTQRSQKGFADRDPSHEILAASWMWRQCRGGPRCLVTRHRPDPPCT